MLRKAKNAQLGAARHAKEDEFYTQLTDIEREMGHYRNHFNGQVVYSNCDDPRISNFFVYFSLNFERLGLKKLITTCYQSQTPDLFSQNQDESAIWLEYTGDRDGSRVPDPSEIGIGHLKGDGDFRSPESIELLKQADIVATNPPFSLFREYLKVLIEHDKKFVILANQNSLTYREVFALLRDNRIWLGHNNGSMAFKVPGHYPARATRSWIDAEGQKWRSFGNMCWFTNLDLPKRHEELILFKQYSPDKYPTYDNFNAIEVGRVEDIPADYDGMMGVPITFLYKHNPAQFEIVGSFNAGAHGEELGAKKTEIETKGKVMLWNGPVVNRRPLYKRIVIRRR